MGMRESHQKKRDQRRVQCAVTAVWSLESRALVSREAGGGGDRDRLPRLARHVSPLRPLPLRAAFGHSPGTMAWLSAGRAGGHMAHIAKTWLPLESTPALHRLHAACTLHVMLRGEPWHAFWHRALNVTGRAAQPIATRGGERGSDKATFTLHAPCVAATGASQEWLFESGVERRREDGREAEMPRGRDGGALRLMRRERHGERGLRRLVYIDRGAAPLARRRRGGDGFKPLRARRVSDGRRTRRESSAHLGRGASQGE